MFSLALEDATPSSPEFISLGCEAITYTRTPTDLPEGHTIQIVLRAVVRDQEGAEIPGAQVSWAVDSPGLVIEDKGNNWSTITITPGSAGINRVYAEYQGLVAVHTIIVYDSGRIWGNRDDDNSFDLDSGARSKVGADMIAFRNGQIQFPSGAALVEGDVEPDPCGMLLPSQIRFFHLTEVPDGLVYENNPIKASAETYIVKTDQGGLYKVKITGLGSLNNELDAVAFIYSKADDDGTFPY